MQQARNAETHRLIRIVLAGQWLVTTVLAPSLLVFGIGLVLTGVPIAMIAKCPRAKLTRHTIAVAQLGWSVALIAILHDDHEAYLHVMGSLVLLTLYRDWRVLTTASVTIGVGLIARILLGGDLLHTFELVGWYAFAMTFFIIASVRGTREVRIAATRQARLQRTKTIIERHVMQRTLELQESADRYRSLVENTEAVTFEYDVKARKVRYVSPQAARLLECSEDDLEDQALLERALHPDDRAKVTAHLAELVEGTRSWSDPIDCRLLTRSARVVHSRTFLNARAGSTRIRAITLDITHQRTLEAELHQAQKLESVGRLAAGVAHEINTPIQFVGDSVSFMRDALTDVLAVLDAQEAVTRAVLAGEPAIQLAAAAETLIEEADLGYVRAQLPRATERALDGVERVASIVRSMKVFSHPDAAEMAPVDLNNAIQSTVTIARNEYRYVANLDAELGELPLVTCYAGEISQVILNIVINAAHAIGDVHAQTGTRGQILVRSELDEDHALITIRDTGGGIPEHVRDRVFDPFFTTKPVGKGTGQGLAMARAVVERHRGSISFETTMGVGTTFHISLPIDPTRRTTQRRAAA